MIGIGIGLTVPPCHNGGKAGVQSHKPLQGQQKGGTYTVLKARSQSGIPVMLLGKVA